MLRPAPVPESAPTTTPFPAAASPAAGFAETLTEGSLAKAPQPESPPDTRPEALQIDAIRQAVVAALAAAGHASASQLLGSAAWKIEGTSLRIEAPGMGKKMLSLTVNAAAEKVIRQELQRLGAPARFLVVPGEGAAAAQTAAPAPPAGSVQEAALAHPLVQKAKEIFKAEVRSVVDLRVKSSPAATRRPERRQTMINPLKISEMLSQANQMQEEVQRKLGQTVVEGTSGGGAVTATMNGKKQLLKLHIDPSAVISLSGGQPDVEMLEDLVVAAVNEAGRKADEAIKDSVQGMLGGLNMPGLG